MAHAAARREQVNTIGPVNSGVRPMLTKRFSTQSAMSFLLCAGLGVSAPASTATAPPKSPLPSIDGTYELTERVMANGAVLHPPSVEALYTMARGRFSLNLFVRNANGTLASE